MLEAAFAGRSAFVTGAGSGIGRAAALTLARLGAAVAVGDIDAALARETVDLVTASGGTARAVPLDVAVAASVEAAVQATVDAFGGLDIAVNNAGIVLPAKRAADFSEDEYDRLMGINLKGVWLCMRAEINRMARGGAIVNISSTAGLRGGRYSSLYAASKHGVLGLTKSAALEYANKGIRINAVCPGSVDTPLLARITGGDPHVTAQITGRNALGRAAQADEIANTIAWLCSDLATYVVGQAVAVDGGI